MTRAGGGPGDVGESFVLEIHRDVTQERAIRESEALFRKLAERASDIISRTDSSGRCIYRLRGPRRRDGQTKWVGVGSRLLRGASHCQGTKPDE